MTTNEKTLAHIREIGDGRRAARQRVADLNARRAEMERQAADLKEERGTLEVQLAAHRVLPGGEEEGGVATTAPPEARLEEIQAELAELDGVHAAAKQEADALDAELSEAVFSALPLACEALQSAVESYRAALAGLATRKGKLTERYVHVLEAEGRKEEAQAWLERLESMLTGDRRTVAAQRAQLRRFQKELAYGASDEERLGWLIARAMRLARAKGVLDEFWSDRGVPLTSTTVFTEPPLSLRERSQLIDRHIPTGGIA